MGSCCHDERMLTQVLVTVPSSSNSEHQHKTQDQTISSDIEVLHLRCLSPAVSEK